MRRLNAAPSIVRLERMDELEALEHAWSSIEERRPSLPVFQSWFWNSVWARTVIPKIKGARLQSYVAFSDGGYPLAVLPCFRQPLAGGALGIVRFLGDRMSFVNGLVCEDPSNAQLAEGVLARLEQQLGRREVAHLKHLDGAAAFTDALRRRGALEVQCRRLIVARDRGEEPLARLSRKSRRTLNWQTNRLNRTFGEARYRVAPAAEAEAAFERFVDFHRSRFRQRGDATLLEGVNLGFLRVAFLELCRRGKAEILELWAGRPIATLLAIIDGERYYSVNSGFDVSFERFSPMKLLLTEGMRRAFALGCRYFELGPDYEPYKQMWRPEEQESYVACIAGRGLVSKVGAAGYRAAFRRVIPAREPRARHAAAG